MINCEKNITVSEQEINILNHVQNNFPVCSDPFSQLADELGLTKQDLIKQLNNLKSRGVISRFGGVVNHKKMGYSTLAALSVPADKVESVAEYVNNYEEVNHNYLREHLFNLWFVVTAKHEGRVEKVLQELKDKSGCKLISLPMVKSFHINLAFNL